MTQSFAANAEDFRRISASLGQMSTSLGDNSREMARVGDDLRSINSQLNAAAANIEALPSASLLTDGLSTLELGTRLFLALILFEATLSALTGLALVMTTVQPRLRVPVMPTETAPPPLGTMTSPPVGTMNRSPADAERGGRGANARTCASTDAPL